MLRGLSGNQELNGSNEFGSLWGCIAIVNIGGRCLATILSVPSTGDNRFPGVRFFQHAIRKMPPYGYVIGADPLLVQGLDVVSLHCSKVNGYRSLCLEIYSIPGS